MPLLLRIEMIVIAVVFVAIVFRTVNKKKLLLKYSLIWLTIALGMIIVSFFPHLVTWLSALVGIETPSNFIYLLGLVALLIITFSLTIILSKQTEQVKTLIQTISIENYLNSEASIKDNPEEVHTNSLEE